MILTNDKFYIRKQKKRINEKDSCKDNSDSSIVLVLLNNFYENKYK